MKMPPKSLQQDSTLQPVSIEVTEEMVKNYGHASGDFNPIHFDKTAAEQKGFPDKIIHGMLSMAVASKIVEPLTAEGYWIRSYEMTFRAPVFVGETITVQGTVSSFQNDQITLDLHLSSPTYPQVATSKISLHVYK